MEIFERRKIQNAIECIDICTRELMYQVLNNVDAHMESTEEAEKKAVKRFIKTPIMNSVNRLQAQKLNLMKLVSDSTPRAAPAQPVPIPTQTALKEA